MNKKNGAFAYNSALEIDRPTNTNKKIQICVFAPCDKENVVRFICLLLFTFCSLFCVPFLIFLYLFFIVSSDFSLHLFSFSFPSSIRSYIDTQNASLRQSLMRFLELLDVFEYGQFSNFTELNLKDKSLDHINIERLYQQVK